MKCEGREHRRRRQAPGPGEDPFGIVGIADPDPTIRVFAAADHRATPEALLTLAGDPDTAVRVTVCGHPNTTDEVLAALAGDPSDDIRRRVASHPSSSPDTLGRLAADPDPAVRVAVAAHRRTPPGTLHRLAATPTDDPDADTIWAAVAANAAVDAAVLHRLAAKPSDAVRVAVACHPRTAEPTLTWLAGDTNVHVRIAATRHPNATLAAKIVAAATDPALYRDIVNSDACPPEMLTVDGVRSFAVYARDCRNIGVALVAVARHPDTPADTLTLLAGDDRYNIRAAVAAHANTPLDVLSRLADDTDSRVRSAVIANPNSGPVDDAHADDEVPTIRAGYAAHPDAAPDILARLAGDPAVSVRVAVAANSATPAAAVDRLARDSNRTVAAAAAAAAP